MDFASGGEDSAEMVVDPKSLDISGETFSYLRRREIVKLPLHFWRHG
jgi:hypothetical protein